MTQDGVKPQSSAEVAAGDKIDEKLPGNQYQPCDAYADKNSFFTFRVREDIVDYFKIERSLKAQDLSLYKPTVSAKAKKPKKPRGSSQSTKSSAANPLPAGKLIKFPTNPEKPTEKKVKGKSLKYYTVRIPYPMSFDALVLWINTQWGENKPAYFVTASGRRHYIASTFKDSNKLRDIGKKA